jgi:hypothetical protein
VAVAIADNCLFASLSSSPEDFRKSLDFCLNAPSYPKLMSVMEEEPSVIGDAIAVLDILKENRNELSQE